MMTLCFRTKCEAQQSHDLTSGACGPMFKKERRDPTVRCPSYLLRI